jgi:hypothetical protein
MEWVTHLTYKPLFCKNIKTEIELNGKQVIIMYVMKNWLLADLDFNFAFVTEKVFVLDFIFDLDYIS